MSQLLQELLDDYASDGEWHSTGRFTIDDARARDVLVRFQSNNPGLFLLHWVRFANLCGAKNTRISWQDSQLIFSHDGEWPTFSSWSTLWGQQHPRERALAYCLWNAMRVSFDEARLVSPEDTLVLDSALEARSEPAPGEFRLILCKPKKPTVWEEYRRMLNERCQFSPTEITYLEREVERPEGVASSFHSIFRGAELTSEPRWPRPIGQGETLPQVVRSAYVASVFIGMKDERQGLYVVLDGVSYNTSAPKGLPRLYIVLSATDLTLDLSGERLVHTKTYASLREWLERDLDSFFRLMIRDLDNAPAGLVPYLEAFISVRLRAKDYTGAYQICRWVLRKIGAGSAIHLEDWQKDRFLNDWQRAAFLYRFALISLLMKDASGGRHLGEQAEKVWQDADLNEPRWLPKADVPDGQMSRVEKINLSRLAVEEQTLDEHDRIRKLLDEQAEQFREQDRWSLVVYCHRWLLELEQAAHARGGQGAGRRVLAMRRALVGISMIRYLRQKATPLNQDWYEAQVYLNQALTGWRGQLDRQSAIGEEDRGTMLEIIDALIHIHLALGQNEGARRLMEVWLEEQCEAPNLYLEQAQEHLQRLKKMLGPTEKAMQTQLDLRLNKVKQALKEARPSTLDLFARFFRRRK